MRERERENTICSNCEMENNKQRAKHKRGDSFFGLSKVI